MEVEGAGKRKDSVVRTSQGALSGAFSCNMKELIVVRTKSRPVLLKVSLCSTKGSRYVCHVLQGRLRVWVLELLLMLSQR